MGHPGDYCGDCGRGAGTIILMHKEKRKEKTSEAGSYWVFLGASWVFLEPLRGVSVALGGVLGATGRLSVASWLNVDWIWADPG